ARARGPQRASVPGQGRHGTPGLAGTPPRHVGTSIDAPVVIRAQGLRRVFGQLVAVDDVSLSVPDGTILALLGPNGAGKTTTVRLLAGLLAPSAGQATVAGCDLRTDPAAVRARVGLVTDSPGLYDQMTPVAYLDFFGRVYGLDTETRRRRIGELLDLLDVGGVGTTRMAGFSRGMQQKI